MADVTIDASTVAHHYTAAQGDLVVWKTDQVGYVLFISSGRKVQYRKTTDGGATYGSAVSILDTGETTNGYQTMAAWFDQSTTGDSGTKVHVVGLDKNNARVRYRSLDVSSDTLGTEVSVVTGLTEDTSGFANDYIRSYLSIAKARGGNLMVFGHTGNTVFMYRSTDGGSTWASKSTSIWDAGLEQDWMLVPAADTDANDLAAFIRDDNTDTIYFYLYDDSADSWDGGTTVGAFMPTGDWYDDGWSMDVVIRHSDGKAIVAWWNDENNAIADLLCSECVLTAAGKTATAKTNVVGNLGASGECALFIDQATGNLYAAYLKGGTWQSSVDVLYKKSTDGGSTWGTETQLNTTSHDIRRVWSGHSVKSGQSGRFMPIWPDQGADDMLSNAANSVAITIAGTVVYVQCDAAFHAVPSRATRVATIVSAGSAGPLLPLAQAPVNFYPSETPLVRQKSKAAGESVTPLSALSVAVPTVASWHHEPLQVRRPRVAIAAALEASYPWSGAPVLINADSWITVARAGSFRRLTYPDAGAPAILPLNPTFWHGEASDRGVAKRRLLDDAGSGLVRPLSVTTPAWWFFETPPPVRLKPRVDEGSAAPIMPKPLADTSWSQPSPQPILVRRRADDASVMPAGERSFPDLSWAGGLDPWPRRRAFSLDASTLPPQATAPYDLSWLTTADLPQRRKPLALDTSFLPPAASSAQSFDLSWMQDAPRRSPARAFPHQESLLVRPLVVTALSPWGWIPEGPAKAVIRKPLSEPYASYVPALVATAAVHGWFPSGPDLGVKRRIDLTQGDFPFSAVSLSGNGWMVEPQLQPRLPRPRVFVEADQLQHPALRLVSIEWAGMQAQVVIKRRPLAGETTDPIRAAQSVALGWDIQPQHQGPRRKVVMGEEVDPSRLVVSAPWGWIAESPGPAVRRRVIDSFSVLAPTAQTASVTIWEPVAPQVVVRSRIVHPDTVQMLRPVVVTPMTPLVWLEQDPIVGKRPNTLPAIVASFAQVLLPSITGSARVARMPSKGTSARPSMSGERVARPSRSGERKDKP